MKKLVLLLSLSMLVLIVSSQTVIKQGLNTLDIASMSAIDTLSISTDYNMGAIMGVQMTFESVTGTTNGSTAFYQKNKSSDMYSVITHTSLPWIISSADETMFFEKSPLYADQTYIIVTKNGMTGGNLLIDLRVRIY